MIWINYVRFLIATRFKQVLIFFLYDHYSFSKRDNMPEISGELSINFFMIIPSIVLIFKIYMMEINSL
jgi:hypothetical protein